MTDHAPLAARPSLGSEASVAWSAAPLAVAAPVAAFPVGNANPTGTIGAGEMASAPAYVPSASIAA